MWAECTLHIIIGNEKIIEWENIIGKNWENRISLNLRIDIDLQIKFCLVFDGFV